MGEAILDEDVILIRSHIVTYGKATTPHLNRRICTEIEQMWNEPNAAVSIRNKLYRVRFHITGISLPQLTELEVLQNTDPGANFFRIEDFVKGNISFVDGLGCNSGYFLLENLYEGSTTAAHEYGHTLGLKHPVNMDIRGLGVPGIMYPRGTLVDAIYQYDPKKQAGTTGGTMHPMHRKVRQEDVEDLKLHKLEYRNSRAILGEFTNIYHWDHADEPGDGFRKPSIFG